ncbi:MAG: HEXXH motif-containing putative peptide modification protein, partial [Hyphomicrobiales bacterium]
TNSPTELYSSPLRADPRPMEGIHHATFVLARMALVAKYLLESGLLSQVENELARKTITNARARFADGLQTLDEHAAYTPSGAQAIAEARAFMNSLQQ